MSASPINLLGHDRAALEAYFAGLGEKPFRARQVLQWVHQRGVVDSAQMTDLSRDLRARLGAAAEWRAPQIEADTLSTDGTRKWLLRLDGGSCIEMVYIPEPDRGTLCVSSQVGCALNCSFCATARQGYNRNLTAAEIVGQVWLATRLLAPRADGERAVTNIVLMGMGEPLLNLDNLLPALRLMLDDLAYGLSRRRVTVSTAGVVPGMDRLAAECPVSLAVSLHAVDDELRTQLVPLNRKYPLEVLLAACRRYVEGDARRRVTFEYTLMAGVNDSPDHARRLARLLRGTPAKVNLIPFNPFADSGYRRPDSAVIDAFRDILLAAGLMTITRRTRGDDIDAACGQLAGRVVDRTSRSRRLAGAAALPLAS